MPLDEPFGDQDAMVVVTHDCDICHEDIAKEPSAELIVLRRIQARPSGERTFMRNPRLLELEARVGEDTAYFRVKAYERWFVPRERLVGVDPAGYLSTHPPDLLVAWLTNRYIRRGFPDAFNERLRPNRKEIEQRLRTGGEHLNAIYLVVEDEELPAEVPYRLIVRGTMLDIDYGVVERRTSAQQAFDGLVAALSGCDGVEVVDDALLSEVDISLHEVRLMKRWSVYDSLSLRVEDEAYARIEPSR
jgi:hypothetical protein